METPIMCSKIPNHSNDWKLSPNVECRIILNKFKTETPEYETMELCRTLRNLSVPVEPAPTVSTTTDIHFKSEFVLDVLLNEILGKCGEKCKVCEEYVQQLLLHIIQAHSGHPNPSPHAQTLTVFKCDICSSIYSSPSMLIRHRNTHSNNSDSLTSPSTHEPEYVRFNSNNISTSFDISPLTTKNESVSSDQCANHPHQPVPISPLNVESNSLKQEPSESQSEMEISNPNPLGILQHMNHLATIQELNDLESQDDLQDPLLLQDIQVPSFVKFECTGISTESEQQTVLVTHDMSSSDMLAGEEQFKSRTCGKGSFLPSDFTARKMTQSSPNPHKCNRCGKCFNKLHCLTQHQLTHTGEKPYKCDVCGKCFTLNYQLTRHKLTHTGEKPFRCDECGMGFRLKNSLALHKLTHSGERPHKCDVCGMCFPRRFILTRHTLTHTGEKSFHCDECGKDFALGNHLTNHKLTHTGERPHKCDVCGKCFARRSALIRHGLTHTGEKPFHCDECGRDFALGTNLTNHKLTHTGERPHKCDVCGQGFSRRSRLTPHKLKHHCLSTVNTTPSFVNHLKVDSESEEERCQEDPLLNL